MLEKIILSRNENSINIKIKQGYKEEDIFNAIRSELGIFYKKQYIEELAKNLKQELRGYATYELSVASFGNTYEIKKENGIIKKWKNPLKGFFLSDKGIERRHIGSVNIFQNNPVKYNLNFYIYSIEEVNKYPDALYDQDISLSQKHARRFCNFINKKRELGEKPIVYFVNLKTNEDLSFLKLGDTGIILRRLFKINPAIYYPFVYILEDKIINQVSNVGTFSVSRGNEQEELNFLYNSMTKPREINKTKKLVPMNNVRAIIYKSGYDLLKLRDKLNDVEIKKTNVSI